MKYMKPEPSNLMTAEEIAGLDQSQETVGNGKPPRIGGLLIFVMIGLFLSLIQNLTYFLASIAPIIRRPLWERLTDPASTDYHPYWRSVLIYDATTCSLILIMNIVMLWLYFRKKRLFPKLIVVLIPLIFVTILTGHFLSGVIPAVAESEEYAKQGHMLVVKFVGFHIWIPYFLLSKRVGRTFVR
jgi:hypothetical protein